MAPDQAALREELGRLVAVAMDATIDVDAVRTSAVALYVMGAQAAERSIPAPLGVAIAGELTRAAYEWLLVRGNRGSWGADRTTLALAIAASTWAGSDAAPTRVAGYCPMGCGQSLALDGAGRVFCHHPGCRNTRAVAALIEDPEHEHVVTTGWGPMVEIDHPLREFTRPRVPCALAIAIATTSMTRPAAPGRYRVADTGGPPHTWTWTRLDDDPAATDAGSSANR